MAEFQPPEGLRQIIERAIANPGSVVRRRVDAHETLCDWKARAVLAALFEACEVREERRIVLDDENVNGLWAPTSLAGSFFSVAAEYASGRVERRLVIETPAEPVSSTGEEPTGG